MTIQPSGEINRALADVLPGPENPPSVATCRFLENFKFQKLIAPVAEDEFRTRHWEQHPLIIPRGRSNYFDDLFSLQDFDDAIARGPDYVKVAEATAKKVGRHQGVAATALENVLADMRSGSTLVLDTLQQREPKLGLLCRLLTQELGYGFQTNLYLTPPNGKGFTPHWDDHDVFILQVVGSKHWKVEKQRRALPAKHQHIPDDERVIRGETHDFTLEQGDIVYIPRGFVHAAECGRESSLHITLGVHPTTLDEFLVVTIKAAAARDEKLRLALPIGFLHGSRDPIVTKALAALQSVTDEQFLGVVVDQLRDELVKRFPLDISGQVSSFFGATQLALDDIVGPRAGVVYRLSRESEAVRVNLGGRVITFYDFLAEPLEFALNTQSYAIRDIAGDLEDSEKLFFVERLMQEGLLVRK